MKLHFLFSFLLILTACSTRPLTTEERAVRILRESDAEKSCIEKGRVYAKQGVGLTFDGIEDQMKIDAHEMGANTIALIKGAQFKAGTAFSCPN